MTAGNVVLVTGANGFLGQYVAREFFGRGWRVVGVDKESMEPQGQTKSMAYYKIDLPDDSFRKIVAEHAPAVCIHCAGGSSVENSIQRYCLFSTGVAFAVGGRGSGHFSRFERLTT